MKTYVQSELLRNSGALNAVSMRVREKPKHFSMRRVHDPNAAEHHNRKELFASLGFDLESVARVEQVHSDRFVRVESPGNYAKADALVTSKPNIALAISIADCVPVLLFDKRQRIAAAVHAGWRGSALNITSTTASYMLDEAGSRPGDMLAFVGPAAGVCCYEVGQDVASRFPAEFLEPGGSVGKSMLDLKAANAAQLVAIGIPPDNIEVSEYCTICNSGFHSFRRDGEASGRMLATIGFK